MGVRPRLGDDARRDVFGGCQTPSRSRRALHDPWTSG
jgi:hypothetical protein